MPHLFECRTVFCFLLEHRGTHFGNSTIELSYRRKSLVGHSHSAANSAVSSYSVPWFSCFLVSMLQTSLRASGTVRPMPNTVAEMNAGAHPSPPDRWLHRGDAQELASGRTGGQGVSWSLPGWLLSLLNLKGDSYFTLLAYILRKNHNLTHWRKFQNCVQLGDCPGRYFWYANIYFLTKIT